MREMRNIVEVIDRLTSVAPDLEPSLRPVKTSCYYTAPEAMYVRWVELAGVLNAIATGHEKQAELASIFRGEVQ